MFIIDELNWLTKTINVETEKGKKFVTKLNNVHTHIMEICPNSTLGRPWIDYTMHIDDYNKCCELLEEEEDWF